MAISKRSWVLLLLNKAPLDRIHLMKALFLLWHRSGRKIEDFFAFEPYLYGPCSIEVYAVLDNLIKEGLVVQAPHTVERWARYYLTQRGKKEVESILIEGDRKELVEHIASEVSKLGFHELLRTVYTEAPEFAINSLVKEVI